MAEAARTRSFAAFAQIRRWLCFGGRVAWDSAAVLTVPWHAVFPRSADVDRGGTSQIARSDFDNSLDRG
jgi:hypothetical protein